MMNRKILVLLVGCVAVAGTVVASGRGAGEKEGAVEFASELLPTSFSPAPAFARVVPPTGGSSIADIAERVVPSVVNVSATRVSRRTAMPPNGHPFFGDPFGPFDQAPSRRGRSRSPQPNSLGSGVIISDDGRILTNSHVVQGAEEITVTLSDGSEVEAKLVGADPKSDVAVLKLKKKVKNLRPIALGNSDSLRLGEVVLAVGNPFGVGQTVTMGIVSALGRGNVGIVDYEEFIQTDAAINPGNSGGALVNMRGELVGINTAILSRTGGYQGIGFAIPTNLAEPIVESLVKDGRVVRGWLGVSIQNIDEDLQSALGLSSRKGVLISDVSRGSPAAKAGVRRGDVVVSVSGKAVDSSARLRNLIAGKGAGKKVTLGVLRDGNNKKLDVTLGEMPGSRSSGAPRIDVDDEESRGLAVANNSAELRRRFQLSEDQDDGVVVVSVEPGSPADRAGLRAGDVIVEMNRKSVASASEFQARLTNQKRAALLLVQRGESTLYVVLAE